MTKIITFSRTFPAYHPKKGQPTFFVEKIWKSLGGVGHDYTLPFSTENFKESIVWGYQLVEGVKYHTIRSGNRWKIGDMFSPRVWSGKPYNSKMITIAPDIEIKKVWDIDIKGASIYINGEYAPVDLKLAKNDGLSGIDMFDWFKVPCNFSGQIICWNDKIEY